MKKIISITPKGKLGNQMIQYMVALSIADLVPDCHIAGFALEPWGIGHPDIAAEGPVYEHKEAQFVHKASLATLLNSGNISKLVLNSYGQRVENLMAPARYRHIFRSHLPEHVGYDEKHLVINVRGQDILNGMHPDYVLIPVGYYEQIIEESGLTPVFMGQIDDNPYCSTLKKAFPGATFIPSRGAITDFETIRQSVNIVPSVSTFSWLAAWLSEAEKIFMPLTGLFNPFQCRDHDFAPMDDARYIYHLFPANYSVPLARLPDTHAALKGKWNRVSQSYMRIMKKRAPLTRYKDRHVEHFEEEFYRRYYTDINAAITAGGLPSGLLHYVRTGFSEFRKPFALDNAFYVTTYPEAAQSLGLGEYYDLYHHYTEIGAQAGYLKQPR